MCLMMKVTMRAEEGTSGRTLYEGLVVWYWAYDQTTECDIALPSLLADIG